MRRSPFARRFVSPSIAFLLLLMATGLTPASLTAQESSDTSEDEKDPEVLAKEKERDLAKLEKEIAEYEKDKAVAEEALEAVGLPESDTEGPGGSATLTDKPGYLGELLSYTTLHHAAREFVESEQVQDSLQEGDQVILIDSFDLSKAGALYSLVDSKLDLFEEEFNKLSKIDPSKAADAGPGGAPSLSVVLGVIQAAADIAAFFRVNRQLVGVDVTPNQQALKAALIGPLAGAKVEPVIPQLSVNAARPLQTKIDAVLDEKKSAFEKRQELEAQVKPAHLAQRSEALKKEITAAKKKNADTSAMEAELKSIEDLLIAWKRYSDTYDTTAEEYDDFFEALTTRPAGGGESPLEMIYLIDLVQGAPDSAKLLFATIASQGGEIEITTSAWRSAKISYVGGSACVFFLTDKSGGLLWADTVPIVRTESFRGKVDADGRIW